MRRKFEQAVLLLALILPVWSMAQTGQALIANPLLSPNKVKEVKRQIMEAAHKELVPLPSLPPPIPKANFATAGVGMPPGIPGASGDTPRQALSRLQVMAIVGDTAVLAMQMPPSVTSRQTQLQMPQMPQMQMSGFQQGVGGQQAQETHQENQYVRRSSSILIKHGVKAFVEGFEVTPVIKGDSVRLLLATMPNEIIYQGSVQPALYSPSTAVANSALEKPSSEYFNTIKPDSTSMTGSASSPPGAQQTNQQPIQPAIQPSGQQR